MPTKSVERKEYDMAKQAAMKKYRAAVRRAEDAYQEDVATALKVYKQAKKVTP